MTEPILLDLCCCEGGSSVGYARAGFKVLGSDLEGRFVKRYPYPFRQADGLWLLDRLNAGESVYFNDGQAYSLSDLTGIHASPPCQGYTRGNAGRETSWPKLIPDFRERLIETGLPYVIENVTDAAPAMHDPVALCGCMFGLSTIDTDGVPIHLKRERMFETNFPLAPPRPCDHEGIEWWAGAYGGARRDKYEAKYVRKGGYVPPDKEVVKRLLGIEHDVTWNGLFECIPPAYSEYVGGQILAHVGKVAA